MFTARVGVNHLDTLISKFISVLNVDMRMLAFCNFFYYLRLNRYPVLQLLFLISPVFGITSLSLS